MEAAGLFKYAWTSSGPQTLKSYVHDKIHSKTPAVASY